MRIQGNGERSRLILAISLLAALGLALAGLAASGYLQTCTADLCTAFKGRCQLRDYVESWGAMAPVAFILIQALQVVIAPIPGELTGAVGGFVFGALPNIVYSTLGLTLGSILAFLAARIIGLPLVQLVVGKQAFEKFHFLTEWRGTLVTFFLFVIPGFPKDILSYLLGVSPMGFWTFTLVCTLGRIPGTVMLSYSGSAVYDENWYLLVAVSVACLLTIATAYFYRDTIDAWVRKSGPEGADRGERSSPIP